MPHSTGTLAIEDGTSLTQAAWDALAAHRHDLGADGLAIGRLDQFLDAANKHPLSFEDRTTILDQAALVLNNLYPHLPFKLEEFQFEHPVEWLEENLRPVLKTMSEVDFHGYV